MYSTSNLSETFSQPTNNEQVFLEICALLEIKVPFILPYFKQTRNFLTYCGNKNHEKRPAVDRFFHADRRTDRDRNKQI